MVFNRLLVDDIDFDRFLTINMNFHRFSQNRNWFSWICTG